MQQAFLPFFLKGFLSRSVLSDVLREDLPFEPLGDDGFEFGLLLLPLAGTQPLPESRGALRPLDAP